MNFKTEAEARECWCPFARVIFLGNGDSLTAHNRYDDGPAPGAKCIASGCMGWRFATAGAGEGPSTLGYCGLAGAPHYATFPEESDHG